MAFELTNNDATRLYDKLRASDRESRLRGGRGLSAFSIPGGRVVRANQHFKRYRMRDGSFFTVWLKAKNGFRWSISCIVSVCDIGSL